jgi:hypothetical protein
MGGSEGFRGDTENDGERLPDSPDKAAFEARAKLGEMSSGRERDDTSPSSIGLSRDGGRTSKQEGDNVLGRSAIELDDF